MKNFNENNVLFHTPFQFILINIFSRRTAKFIFGVLQALYPFFIMSRGVPPGFFEGGGRAPLEK
jgi:hypothetical protein